MRFMKIDNLIGKVLSEIKNPPMKLIKDVQISEELSYHIENKEILELKYGFMM